MRIRNLVEDVIKLQNNNEGLTNENSNLTTQLHEAGIDYGSLGEKVKKLATKLLTTTFKHGLGKTQNKQLIRRLSILTYDLILNKEEKEKIKKERNELAPRVTELEIALNKEKVDLGEALAKVTELENVSKSQKTTYDREKDSQKDEWTKINQKLQEAQNKLKDTDFALKGMEAEKAILEEQIKVEQQNKVELESERNDLNNQLVQSQKDYNDMSSATEAEKIEKQKQIKNLQDEVDKKNSSIQNIIQNQAKANKEKAELEKKLTDIDDKIKAKDKEISEFTKNDGDFVKLLTHVNVLLPDVNTVWTIEERIILETTRDIIIELRNVFKSPLQVSTEFENYNKKIDSLSDKLYSNLGEGKSKGSLIHFENKNKIKMETVGYSIDYVSLENVSESVLSKAKTLVFERWSLVNQKNFSNKTKDTIDNLSKASKEFESKYNNTQSMLDISINERGLLENQNEMFKNNVTELTTKMEELNDTIDKGNAKLGNLQKQKEALEINNKNLEKEKQDLLQIKLRQEQEMKEKEEDYQQKLQAQNQNATNLQGQINSLSTAVLTSEETRILGNVNNLLSNLITWNKANFSTNLDVLRKEAKRSGFEHIGDIPEKALQLGNKVDQIIQQYETQRSTDQQQLNNLNGQVKAKDLQITQLNQQVSNLNNQLYTERTNLNNTIASLTNTINQLQPQANRVAGLESTISSLNNTISSLQQISISRYNQGWVPYVNWVKMSKPTYGTDQEGSTGNTYYNDNSTYRTLISSKDMHHTYSLLNDRKQLRNNWSSSFVGDEQKEFSWARMHVSWGGLKVIVLESGFDNIPDDVRNGYVFKDWNGVSNMTHGTKSTEH